VFKRGILSGNAAVWFPQIAKQVGLSMIGYCASDPSKNITRIELLAIWLAHSRRLKYDDSAVHARERRSNKSAVARDAFRELKLLTALPIVEDGRRKD
jgi:hypothetical protein